MDPEGARLSSRVLGVALWAAFLVPAAGCEWVTGISDKTLVSTGVGCSKLTGYFFCDDFDSDPSFGASWDWHTPAGATVFGFDAIDSASAPRSGQFGCPPDAVNSAQLGHQGGQLPGGLRVTFDLRLDVDGLSALAQTSVIQVLTATSGLSINYVLGPGAQASLQIFLATGGSAPVASVNLPTLPPLRQWTHVELSTDWKTFTVTEDGARLASTPSPVTGAPGGVSLIAGIVYVNPLKGAPPVTLELDDIALFAL